MPDATTDEYADAQLALNEQKAIDFVAPLIRDLGARSVLDVGCGVGRMVTALLALGYESFGVDLSSLRPRWERLGMPRDRLFVVGPDRLVLPFRDQSLDFAFTLGVIEHVGTVDGHATRRRDYKLLRTQWTQEVFRTLKIGGSMLLAGPNRSFPVDVAHGLDLASGRVERWLSARAGASVHRIWGDYFLWSYGDLRSYLAGCSYEMRPVSVASYLHYSRVPSLLRPLVKGYVSHLPRRLLGTGFNPWMAALIRRTG